MRILSGLFGLLFGLAFAGGGFFILYQTAWPTWQNWQEMRSWQPVAAQLLEVSGSDSDTRARYRYSVNGSAHENDRVYVAEFTDNIGSYHGDLQKELRAKRYNGGTVTVWFNPLDPEQSVIDRDMRWGLFALMVGFCSIFILIGLGVVYASMKPGRNDAHSKTPSLSALRSEWKERQKDPAFRESFLEFSRSRTAATSVQQAIDVSQRDWKKRKGWNSALISSDMKVGIWVIWVFAAAWNAISFPLLYAFVDEWNKGNHAILLGLLFPLVGAFLLYKAITMTIGYRRFGKILYEMDPWPGAIGGNVGGRVHIPNWRSGRSMGQRFKARVRLECVYTYVSGSGKNRSRSESIKWAEEGEPKVERAGPGLSLAFRFEVPEGLPESDVEQSGAYHFWRLSAEVERSGVDIRRRYNIPVFRTGERSVSVRENISAQVSEKRERVSRETRDAIAAGNFDIPGLSRAMRLTDFGGELRLFFPMFRNKLLTLFASIFAGGFGFASYSMMREFAGSGFFGVFVPLFSMPFVLVAVVAAIATIYLAFNNLHVVITANRVSVLRKLFFIPLYRRNFAWSDIDHIFLKRSGSTGQGTEKIEHYKVRAKLKGGRNVTLAEDIDGEDVASHFRDYLARRMSVKGAPES